MLRWITESVTNAAGGVLDRPGQERGACDGDAGAGARPGDTPATSAASGSWPPRSRWCARAGSRDCRCAAWQRSWTRPSAITYHYFPNKSAVVEAVAEVVVEEITAADDPAQHWRDRLLTLMLTQNANCCAIPGIARFLVENHDRPVAARWTEAYLRVLLDGGFSPAAAARAFSLVSFFINPAFLIERPGRDHRAHGRPDRRWPGRRGVPGHPGGAAASRRHVVLGAVRGGRPHAGRGLGSTAGSERDQDSRG